MAINPDRLLAFPIPEVRQRISKRDVILYALSIGLGEDPLDGRQLDYVDHHRALRAMPSMAVVLGHPGFWLSDERTGVDAVKLVHGEQSIAIHRPLPVDGEVIGRTSVTGLIDKGKGRGALLFTEKHVTEAASGELLAVTKATIFLRGDGGFGESTGPSPQPHPMPSRSADIVVELSTRPEQALFYRLNGDDNPLHADPAVAARAGFPRPILHGLCTFGIVTHALLRGLADYDSGAIHQMALRFSAPVFPGETIRTEMWRDGSFRARVTERDVIVVDHGFATIRGSA
jgi:acyl dehydratase